MKTKINEEFMVTATVGKHTARIYVNINQEDEVTITNDKKQPQFVFTRSNPEMLDAMAHCFKEAVELVAERKVTTK